MALRYDPKQQLYLMLGNALDKIQRMVEEESEYFEVVNDRRIRQRCPVCGQRLVLDIHQERRYRVNIATRETLEKIQGGKLLYRVYCERHQQVGGGWHNTMQEAIQEATGKDNTK